MRNLTVSYTARATGAPVAIDRLLTALVQPDDREQTEAVISELISRHVEPVIRGIIQYKIGSSSHSTAREADVEDLRQEAIVQLLLELRKFSLQPLMHPISDVRGLAAVIAHRACLRWMRRQFPERHALKNRLYYLLMRHDTVAVWCDENKRMVAGLANWQRQKTSPTQQRLVLPRDEWLVAQVHRLKSSRDYAEITIAFAVIFDYFRHPVELDKLVTALASLITLEDRPVQSTGGVAMETAITRERDPAWQVEKRLFLERLWKELQLLPLHQRTALLLNLKDGQGGSCLALFPMTGVATVFQLAAALQMPVPEFKELCKELPLDDVRIASILHLTRQQVINARRSARERLTRRLKGFI